MHGSTGIVGLELLGMWAVVGIVALFLLLYLNTGDDE